VLDDQESLPEEERWTVYYDEPDKRVYYKQEEGLPYGSVLTDCVIEAGFTETVACFDNVKILEELMPEFYGLEWVKRLTDLKGLLKGVQ